MNQQEWDNLDNLTLSLNTYLSILNSAIKYDDGDLEISTLIDFVEKIYQTSKDVRHVFECSLF